MNVREKYIRLAAFYATVEGPRKSSKRLADAASDRAAAFLEAAGINVPEPLGPDSRLDAFTRSRRLEAFVRDILREEGIARFPQTRAEALDLEYDLEVAVGGD